jgi:hypothetical protein
MTRLPQIRGRLVALAFVLSVTANAAAQESHLEVRKLGVTQTGQHLAVSFSYRDAFTSKIKEKLKSGLPTRVMLQINLEREGTAKPVAFWFRSATIVYDLWEEVFIVTVEDVRGRRHAKAKTASEAINLAGSLASARVASIASQPPGSYRLRVLVEVNPVSKELVDDIRRWLARPPASTTGVDAQSNFFGSFVGIFVDRRIGQADHTVAFVSQWFKLGEP